MSAFASYRRRETLAKSEAVRIASLLGLKSADRIDDVTLAEHVAGGIEVEAAHALREMIAPLGPKAFYEIVSEPTLRRAGPRKRLTRGPSERVYEIGRVLDRVATIFRGDTDRIVRFMTRPNPVLKGHTPFEMASSSSAGANAVIRLLDEAEAGLAL
ncbi:MAG TPA: antitoxin Xre/MbcA/ParS toxin-binding domain-containing protein [Afifellaceae bacterium]|nr:antitoxin Xre/MbcA/ParS toxin-binding domain-containing protein [Afifellaceae bacterium]